MAIYGRINDVSPLKGFNGNEISYQSIQLPSWLEEKDKKNFLRFYYMLRYGIEIGDNNILATQVYDEGKFKDIILYSGLCSEKPNSIHVESNNMPLVPAIRTSNNSIIDTNGISYNYGVRLHISGAHESFGTLACVHLDIYNGFYGNNGYGILDYAKDLGFYIKCKMSIYDNNYGNIETIIDYNSNYQINVHNTGEHYLEAGINRNDEVHNTKFNFIQIILNYNNTDRNIAQILFDDYLFNGKNLNEWNGAGPFESWYSYGEDAMRSFGFSNNNFNWDF